MLTVEQALEIINQNKKVAIVGLSPKEDRPSHRVAKFLLDKGFEVIPVTPIYKEILGIPCKKALSEIEKGEIDWVDFFVNPTKLKEFTSDLVELSPKLVWCQIGVVDNEFNNQLTEKGIPYIADLCPKMELEKTA